MSVEKEIRVVGAKRAEADIQGVQNALDNFNKTVSKNRDATRLLDRATGGAVTQFQDLQKGLVQGVTGIKNLSLSFKGLKGAIAATGIGLIVVALGTIYAYWDDIKEAISGVSAETKTLLGLQEKQVQTSNDLYDNISGSESILKQQGKTEKEILNLKIKATDETITALEAQLLTQKEVQKAQIDTAKRNKDILEGILKMLSLPLFILLETIDSVGKALGKDFGLTEGLYGSLANLIFDPEEIKIEGEESIKETEKQLLKLKNRKASFENNITNIEKTEADKRFAEKEKQYKKEFDAYKKHLEEMTQLTIDDIEKLGQIRKSYNDKIDAQAVVDEETKLELDREKALKEIEELELAEGLKGNARLAVNTFYDNQLIELAKKTSEQEKAQRLADFTATKEIESAKFGLLGQFGGLLQQIAGENKTLAIAGVVAQQAAAVGQIISQTAIANAKAVAALPLTLGQPWVGINTASAGLSIASTVASAAKSISKIKSSDSSASTMTANVPQAAGGAAAAPPSFNIVGQSSTDQLTQAITGQTQEPVKAYVVSNDVTTAQSLDRNIVQGATIG
tara:strand:+ start:4617 stop:6317 length:1701 start_codon:yes stop_codon:yes gene_type:complete